MVSYSAIAHNRESSLSIEALTPCTILQFDYDRWQELIENDNLWYPYTFKLVESLYLMKKSRERSFLMDDATKRYLDFRRDYPTVDEKVKLHHVASSIGVTPEALSRLRRRLSLI